jgi:hypothetical protein
MHCWVFWGAFAKLPKATIGFVVTVCSSVCPCGKTRLPVEGFSWHLTFEYFSKMYTENSSIVKIWEEDRVFYVKTNMYFWSYLAQFSLEWEMFNCRDKTHILCSITLFRKSCLLRYNVEKYLEPDGPQMTIWHMRCAWIPNTTNTRSEYVKHFFQRQPLFRASILRHTYTACLVNCWTFFEM